MKNLKDTRNLARPSTASLLVGMGLQSLIKSALSVWQRWRPPVVPLRRSPFAFVVLAAIATVAVTLMAIKKSDEGKRAAH